VFASVVLAAATLLAPAMPANCTKAVTFTGTVCAPATPGKHPAIVLLGGSEGGDSMAPVAPEFAAHGYVAASVAYFGLPGFPKLLDLVPVETVGGALAELAKRPDVDPNRIAIFGISKGGELALLAASTYPQVRAVVADVPSPFGWESIPNGPVSAPHSSWTANGKPVPFVPYAAAMGQAVAQSYMQQKPLDLRPGYAASMGDKAAVTTAMFHLENIHGPVLCLAAQDDQIWDSPAQCTIATEYLQAHRHSYADASEVYAGAGHVFLFATAQQPFVQAAQNGMQILLGGTPEGNVAAGKQAWPKIFSFLGSALQAGSSP
jgi:dienelactone hydrolase